MRTESISLCVFSLNVSMTIYNLNVDIVNDNVYTKKGLNKSIPSQHIKKLISDVNQGPLICCKFAKNYNLLSQRRSCH